MGHSYNNGLHTSSKGFTIDAVRVTALTVATPTGLCTIAEDCKSGLVSSVTHTATGTYVFQLSRPYPPKVILIDPSITGTNATTDLIHARYVENSYSATTGQFTVVTSDDDDAGAPVAVNPSATNQLMVLMLFNRYTR